MTLVVHPSWTVDARAEAGKPCLIASLLGKELPSFAKLEGEISVFKLLSGYYGQQEEKASSHGDGFKSPASGKAGHFRVFLLYSSVPLPGSGVNRINRWPSFNGAELPLR